MRVYFIPPLALALASCGETPPCERDVEAFVMSQSFIERQLRSPSTAEFPSITEATVTPIPKGDSCAFRVVTYVDAQNAFGGTVRENFIVELEPETPGSDTWELLGISSL